MSEDFNQKAKELILRYRDDPLLFVQELMKPTKVISEQQESLLRAVAKPGAKVSVRSGHGTGKTTTQAWLVLWFLCTRKNVKIPCTASTQSQLKDVLWAEIDFWQKRMPAWWREQIKISNARVEIKGYEAQQFAVARTAGRSNPDALQGFHAENILFIIDEASGVFDKVFEVAKGALSTAGARVVMCGNPTQTEGYFFQSHHKNREAWTRLHFNGEESPHVDKEFVDDMAREYGTDSDIYRVRVRGDFPKASINQLIGNDLVEAALKRTLRPEQISFAAKILGVDVAPYGDDRSAIFYRQGLYSELLYSCNGIDDIEFAGKIVEFVKSKGIDGVFVDRGAGSGVLSALSHLGYGYITTGVSFGGSPGAVRYLNKRVEMWGDLKDWIVAGGAICGKDKEGDITSDLTGPQYFYSISGKLQLERKEDMKKRGLASPDLGDALALTFAFPVASRSERERHFGGEAETGNMDYDPFS